MDKHFKLFVIPLIIYFCFLTVPTRVQSSEYLDIPFHALGAPDLVLNEYFFYLTYLLLEESLDGGKPYVRVICLPTGEAEWALTLAEPEGENVIIEYIESFPSVWSQMMKKNIDLDSLGIIQGAATIPKPLAEKIGEIWEIMLTNEKLPAIDNPDASDIGYFFTKFSPKHGPLTGVSWGQEDESPTGLLIQLVLYLKDYVDAFGEFEEPSEEPYIIQVGPRSAKTNEATTEQATAGTDEDVETGVALAGESLEEDKEEAVQPESEERPRETEKPDTLMEEDQTGSSAEGEAVAQEAPDDEDLPESEDMVELDDKEMLVEIENLADALLNMISGNY